MTLRPTQGPARKAQSSAATIGSGPGDVKKTLRSGSLLPRSTTHATLTTVNTHSSRNAVVPDRFATILLSGSPVTYQIRPSARTVENAIPAQGVLRVGSTFPNGRGRTACRAIP